MDSVWILSLLFSKGGRLPRTRNWAQKHWAQGMWALTVAHWDKAALTCSWLGDACSGNKVCSQKSVNYRFSSLTIIFFKNPPSDSCGGIRSLLSSHRFQQQLCCLRVLCWETICINKSCPPHTQFCCLLSEYRTVLVWSAFARIASVISPAEAYLCAILGISPR